MNEIHEPQDELMRAAIVQELRECGLSEFIPRFEPLGDFEIMGLLVHLGNVENNPDIEQARLFRAISASFTICQVLKDFEVDHPRGGYHARQERAELCRRLESFYNSFVESDVPGCIADYD